MGSFVATQPVFASAVARRGVGHRAKIEGRLEIRHPMIPGIKECPDSDLEKMHEVSRRLRR
jgi:hypothetical protein